MYDTLAPISNEVEWFLKVIQMLMVYVQHYTILTQIHNRVYNYQISTIESYSNSKLKK